MRTWSFALIVCYVMCCSACSGGFRAVIVAADPFNGTTAVITTEARPETPERIWGPKIEFADGVRIEAPPGEKRVLFQRLEGNQRTELAGALHVEGTQVTFVPETALARDRDYELVVERTALVGENLDEVDRSELPEELITWPYRLRFSTRSVARVRAVYLTSNTDDNITSITLHFSQSMNPIASSKRFSVTDVSTNQLTITDEIWLDGNRVRLDLDGLLDPVALYTLKVAHDAQAEDGALLDGDGDGIAGEPNDDFVVQFTGSQAIVVSRLPRAP